MRKRHEQSLIDAFSKHFLQIAKDRGRTALSLSLDGQDSVLGADYIFTEGTNFAMVEFKYEVVDLKAEGKKELRSALCINLDREKFRRNQSLQCHYIAWSEKQSEKREILVNKYYPEICNNDIFPHSILRNSNHDTSSRVCADNLIYDFIDGSIGSGFEIFNNYVNWLLSIAGKEGVGVEVMLDNPDSDQLDILEFNSLNLLNDWLFKNRPEAAQSPSFTP